MKYNKLPDEIKPRIRKWSAMQLWIYAEIYTMHANGRKFYKTNSQIAEGFGTDERTVRRIISGFVTDGVLTSYQDGKQRFLTAKPIDNWREDSKVPGLQSPRTAKSAKEDSKVLPRRTAKSAKGGQQSPPNREENREVNREVNREKGASLVLPFDSDAFRTAWQAWKDERRARKIKPYTPRGEQGQLHRLQKISQHDEQTAIDIIATSIAQGYQGLFPITRNADAAASGVQDWASEVRDQLEDHWRNQ